MSKWNDNSLKASARSRKNWQFAKEHKNRFLGFLPSELCETAMATCRFLFRDKASKAAGGAWGFAYLCCMQTYGIVPQGISDAVAYPSRDKILLQSEAASNAVLQHFGLSVKDIFIHFGQPKKGEVLQLDLLDIVSECC